MAKGLIWATAEDMPRSRPHVLSVYRRILRSLSSPKLPLNLAARFAKKAEVRAIFLLGSAVLRRNLSTTLLTSWNMDTAEYSLFFAKGKSPSTYSDSRSRLSPLLDGRF